MIEIISELGRLPKAEEDAINLLLVKYGGEFQGAAYYRLGWAPDDNAGLAKMHVCGRTDPFDVWNCSCLNAPSNRLPVCFHPIQNSYHLKSWEPPDAGAEDTLLIQSQLGVSEDLSKGSYRCLFHLVDAQTQTPLQLPILRELVVEAIIPLLKVGMEGQKALAYGRTMRRKELIRQRQKEAADRESYLAKSYDSFADSLLGDAIPAFGGESWGGGHGAKSRHSSELETSDIAAGQIITEV